jgi:uncharacterized membrane protein
MSDLIAIGFDSAVDAFAMRAALAGLQTQSLIEIEDAVVLTRADDGKVELPQGANLATVAAMGGGLWSILLGTNRAALIVLVRKVTSHKVFDQLRAFAGKGRVLQTSLAKEKEDGLRTLLEERKAAKLRGGPFAPTTA